MSTDIDVKTVLITGGASGIGEGLAHKFIDLGYAVTVADIDENGAQRVVEHLESLGGRAIAVHCDVRCEESQRHLFQRHMQAYGRLDIAILNAGIMESGDFLAHASSAWKHTLDVNLLGVMVGVRLAVEVMGPAHCGTILLISSAGGIFPMPLAPVYSVSKAGVVMLTQSLGPPLMHRFGIKLLALCPQFIDTSLLRKVTLAKGSRVKEELLKEVGGQLLTVDQVVSTTTDILLNESNAGDCVILLSSGQTLSLGRPSLLKSKRKSSGKAHQLPERARKIVVKEIAQDFDLATEIVSFNLPKTVADGCVVVKNLYCGINASDINFASGRYQFHTGPSPLPYDAGFEATGYVVAASSDVVSSLKPGDFVATMQFGGFSEYAIVPAKNCFRVKKATPEVLALITSGLTASIALEQAAKLVPGNTVLVTAAAGGTGQFFVQLAKLAKCHVIATCSTHTKVDLLTNLGADRVINYKDEDVKTVLKNEYPNGVDVICELVGGEMFQTCLNALAPKGRLIVIGAVSQYSTGWKQSVYNGVPEKLLMKSASVIGFFLPMYAEHFKRHFQALQEAFFQNQVHVAVDPTEFIGLESVGRAVAYLLSGKNIGKVVVRLVPNSKL